MQVATTDLARAVLTGPVKAAITDPAAAPTDRVEAARVIWTARLRIDRAADFRANVSRAFKAAALIDPGAVEDLGVIALVVVAALAEEDLADLAAAAAAGSEVGAEN